MMPTEARADLLTRVGLAAKLGVTTRTIYAWRTRGLIPEPLIGVERWSWTAFVLWMVGEMSAATQARHPGSPIAKRLRLSLKRLAPARKDEENVIR